MATSLYTTRKIHSGGGTSHTMYAYVRYTFEPEYSDTQSRLRIHSFVLRHTPSNVAYTIPYNSQNYLQATVSGLTPASGSSNTTISESGPADSLVWSASTTKPYVHWSPNVTYYKNVSFWDSNVLATYYFDRGQSEGTVRLALNAYLGVIYSTAKVSLTVPALPLPPQPTNPIIQAKVAGEWADGTIKAKVNGEWVDATGLFVKVNGTWIQIE